MNTVIKETPMSGPFDKITVNNNHIYVKQAIHNNYQLMCCADITADMNGNIEAIELHYTGNVEIQNKKQLDELNQLLKQNLQNITGLGVNISNIMLFLSYLTNNQIRINLNIANKVYFIYGPLLQLNQEYEGIKTDVADLPRAIKVTSDTNEPINDGYLSLKAIKGEFPKYKKTIDTAINSISSKIDTFKTKLRAVNGNANEQIENKLNEMKQNLHNTKFEIGLHGIEYKPNENKIIQSNPYTNYDGKNECWVKGMVEIKLDQQYNIEYLLFIDETKNKTIKILPNIPFYLNGKKFTLEDCILHHNAGLGTKWINGEMAENSTRKTEQFEQIEKQQIDYIKSFNCSNKLLKQCMQKLSKTDNKAEQLNYLITHEKEIKEEIQKQKALAKKLNINTADLWVCKTDKNFDAMLNKIIINNTLGISIKEFNKILEEKFEAKTNEAKIAILTGKKEELKQKIQQLKIKKIKDKIKQDKKFDSTTISKMLAPKNIVNPKTPLQQMLAPKRINPKTPLQQVLYSITTTQANNKNR